jgi:hypothetical protein
MKQFSLNLNEKDDFLKIFGDVNHTLLDMSWKEMVWKWNSIFIDLFFDFVLT